MPGPYLEHLNLTVLDVDRALRFLQTAMPQMEVRGSGTGEKCKRWMHVGVGDISASKFLESPSPHGL